MISGSRISVSLGHDTAMTQLYTSKRASVPTITLRYHSHMTEILLMLKDVKPQLKTFVMTHLMGLIQQDLNRRQSICCFFVTCKTLISFLHN